MKRLNQSSCAVQTGQGFGPDDHHYPKLCQVVPLVIASFRVYSFAAHRRYILKNCPTFLRRQHYCLLVVSQGNKERAV